MHDALPEHVERRQRQRAEDNISRSASFPSKDLFVAEYEARMLHRMSKKKWGQSMKTTNEKVKGNFTNHLLLPDTFN
jgi:hypothetical protein